MTWPDYPLLERDRQAGDVDLSDRAVILRNVAAVLADERFWLTPAYTLAIQVKALRHG